ncbi:Transgelin-2 [Platysternon megacephalum]|uniref:sphingomyelin phosphodiesterase n=1 Tax=Platysternon megacephalum TaxID=55544 RepID=A0A4D9DPT8_9SAUR|nr:Transgelin-2 [Platysternon megacephalum]
MVLRESPFPNRLLSGLYSLGQHLLFPSYWAADCLLDLRETTAEQQQNRRQRCPLRALVTGPWLLLLLLLSMPVALLGLLLWLPLQAARRPFAYKHTMLPRHPQVWELPGKGKAFSFVSANVCLLPNGLAKFSNLGQIKQRLFQDAQAQRGDVVAFDVFCGDFNFDNCSSGDELEQTHDIFRQYQDPCRVGPRQDQPWAIGTLLNYLEIHEEAVSTPENMKRTLEQEEGRRTYLAGPILRDGRPDPSAAGSPWEGRRIDYILYREHPAPISLTTEVEKFSFITQLAGCSDHLAVGLRLLLNPAPQ